MEDDGIEELLRSVETMENEIIDFSVEDQIREIFEAIDWLDKALENLINR